jgi:hypothetical protein
MIKNVRWRQQQPPGVRTGRTVTVTYQYRSCGVKDSSLYSREERLVQANFKSIKRQVQFPLALGHNITSTYVAMQNTLITKELMRWTQLQSHSKKRATTECFPFKLK